jgi:prepilin-type N-terminal cleavage/methylation domain-containing protein
MKIPLLRIPVPGRGALGRSGRRGFSLVEILMVIVIIGTLARIAIPNYQGMTRKARAADVIGNFEVVRVAVFSYNADTHRWPPDVNRGQVPPELENYLPEGFDFTFDGYLLDWENWVLPDGLPSQPGTGVILGVSLVTDNEDLGNEVLNLLGESAATYSIGDHYTYILEGT